MSWQMLQPFVVIEPRRRRELIEVKSGCAGRPVVWTTASIGDGGVTAALDPDSDGIPVVDDDDLDAIPVPQQSAATVRYTEHPELVLAAILKDVA